MKCVRITEHELWCWKDQAERYCATQRQRDVATRFAKKVVDLVDLLRAREADLRDARETNARLNRRCQEAEAALSEKIGNVQGRSLGRVLANAAASMYQRRLAEADEVIGNMEAALRDLGACDDPSCSEPNCLHALAAAEPKNKGEK